MDCAEVAHEEWQAFYARPGGDGGEISSRKGDQGFEFL
jgi:hypothetical protein